MITPKACKECSFITENEKCPLCNGETSKEWTGYLIVMEPKFSEIAKQLGINHDGQYALKVR